MEDIGISLSYIESHMGKYGDYCPVSFVDHNELVKGAEGTQYMAEYQVCRPKPGLSLIFALNPFAGSNRVYTTASPPQLPSKPSSQTQPNTLPAPHSRRTFPSNAPRTIFASSSQKHWSYKGIVPSRLLREKGKDLRISYPEITIWSWNTKRNCLLCSTRRRWRGL